MKTNTLKKMIRHFLREATADSYGISADIESSSIKPEYSSMTPLDAALKLIAIAQTDKHLGPELSHAIKAVALSSPEMLIALTAAVIGIPAESRALKPQAEMLRDMIQADQPHRAAKLDRYF